MTWRPRAWPGVRPAKLDARSGIAGMVLAATLVSCAGAAPREERARMPPRSIQDVLAAHNDSLMALSGVVGTAIGLCDGTPCIRVFVTDSAAAQRARVEPRLEGYPVRVEVTGPFRARPERGESRG